MTGPPHRPLLDVVVPTLDEAGHLPSLLNDLRALRIPVRVTVVDGGSTDGTPELARRAGVRVLESEPGRARQLDRGARAGEAPWLLFLHADSHLPPFSAHVLEDFLDGAGRHDAAYFQFSLAGAEWFWRFIEFGQRLREDLSGLVYGDQGLVVSRPVYEATGGFPDQPLMEDVAMMDRVRRHATVERLPAPLVTSPRRYRREGRWQAWLRNTALISLYRAGVDPERLARWYPPHPRGAPGRNHPRRDPSRVLLVFAKAPRPGRVKTRLAADVGDREAARLYRSMGRKVVNALRDGPWRTVVAYAPVEAGEEVARWLGRRSVEFWAQDGGDLGERMERAFERAFASASRACIVGTDAPDLDGELVASAFRALESADVVLGPARDGGYYLVALDTPRPELFRDVPWSTDAVLATTLRRVHESGLRARLLPELTDVDTLDDLATRQG